MIHCWSRCINPRSYDSYTLPKSNFMAEFRPVVSFRACVHITRVRIDDHAILTDRKLWCLSSLPGTWTGYQSRGKCKIDMYRRVAGVS